MTTPNKKAGHTPGPWDLFDLGPAIKAGNIRPGADGTAYRIYGKSTLLLEVRACPDGFVFGQNEANAHLIAAAPDLLEAAKECLRHLNWDMNNEPPFLAKLRSAISKAEAKASGEGA